jgi:hypothetical protein
MAMSLGRVFLFLAGLLLPFVEGETCAGGDTVVLLCAFNQWADSFPNHTLDPALLTWVDGHAYCSNGYMVRSRIMFIPPRVIQRSLSYRVVPGVGQMQWTVSGY